MAKKAAKGRRRKRIQMPRTGTQAACDFFATESQVIGFTSFVSALALHIDQAAETAHKALLEGSNAEESARLKASWNSRRKVVVALRDYRQMFCEIILSRLVENYLNYVSTILNGIFIAKPQVLRSSEEVRLDVVLSYDSLPSFISALAERKVEKLSYRSFKDLSDFFSNKCGIELVPNDLRPMIAEAIAIRNVSVHNRCIINRRYLALTGKSEALLGTLRGLQIDEVHDLQEVMSRSVIQADKAARKKFALKRVRFSAASPTDRHAAKTS